MKIIIIIIAALLALTGSQIALAANFGDEVADCVVKKGPPYGVPMKSGAFLACQKEVEASRATLQNTTSPKIDVFEVFRTCLRTSAAAQDDRISTASDIALAAATSCEPQWQGVLMETGTSLTQMAEYPSNSVKTTALQIVLAVRKNASGAKR